MEELNTGATSTVTTCSSWGACSFFALQLRTRAPVRANEMSRVHTSRAGLLSSAALRLRILFIIFRNFLSPSAELPVRRDNESRHHRRRCAPARAYSAHRRPPEPSIPRLDIAD